MIILHLINQGQISVKKGLFMENFLKTVNTVFVFGLIGFSFCATFFIAGVLLFSNDAPTAIRVASGFYLAFMMM